MAFSYPEVEDKIRKFEEMYKTVAECYKKQSVFITGGTGFLGKVIIEKLLYSCPSLDKLYLLVREQQNANAQQRIQMMWEQPLFSRLRNKRPQAFKKIVPIVGDISKLKLGIEKEDEELLINKVSLVFHVAATVKFTEPLDVAMNVNVGGTERVLDLSKRMKNIKGFVHVSTVYAHTDRAVIDEIVYPEPAKLFEVKKLIKNGITKKQAKKILKDRPNTYTFTKALAENVVAENHGNVPAIIIRPSIVTSNIEEPFVGWIDNLLGAASIANTVAKGWNHIILGLPTNILDLIPVDYVSNSIIVAASRFESKNDVTVYNCSTSTENPVTIGQFMNMIIDDSHKHSAYERTPYIYFTNFKPLLLALTFILQTVPAYAADVYLLMKGKNLRYSKIQAKAAMVRYNVDYFTSHSWKIPASRTRTLADSLSPSDRKTFPFDLKSIDWKVYFPTYFRAIRQFVCNKN